MHERVNVRQVVSDAAKDIGYHARKITKKPNVSAGVRDGQDVVRHVAGVSAMKAGYADSPRKIVKPVVKRVGRLAAGAVAKAPAPPAGLNDVLKYVNR